MLFDFIVVNYKAPLTAKNYINGLFSSIDLLSHSAGSFTVQNHKYFTKYGSQVHRLNYKKMTIIFTLHNDIVYIHRIMPSALIIQK